MQKLVNWLNVNFDVGFREMKKAIAIIILDKSPKKGEFGVLNPTSKLDLENELINMFQIKYSKTEVNKYITIFEKKAF